MTTRIAADYTNRSNYQKQYAKDNKAAINARKRAWREARKIMKKMENCAYTVVHQTKQNQ